MRPPSCRRGPGGSGKPPVGSEGVLRAAVQVFERVGFEAATVRSIATEAGVSPAALYHHFQGMDDLVVAVCEPKVAALKVRLEALRRAASSPMNHALAILEAAMAWALQNLDVYELVVGGTRAQRSDLVGALGRKLETACLRELEAALSGSIGPSLHDRARIETSAKALWAGANGALCLCLRLGCPELFGALLSAAVEPVLRDTIAAELTPANSATACRSTTEH